MSRWPLLIFRSVGQRSMSKVFICWGRGALVFYKQLYFTWVFCETRLFTWYHDVLPSGLDFELWITYTKCCYSYLVASRRTSLSSDKSCWVLTALLLYPFRLPYFEGCFPANLVFCFAGQLRQDILQQEYVVLVDDCHIFLLDVRLVILDQYSWFYVNIPQSDANFGGYTIVTMGTRAHEESNSPSCYPILVSMWHINGDLHTEELCHLWKYHRWL